MTTAASLLEQAFTPVTDMIRQYAVERAAHPALILDERRVSYAELDAMTDRFAASLQRDAPAMRSPCARLARSITPWPSSAACAPGSPWRRWRHRPPPPACSA